MGWFATITSRLAIALLALTAGAGHAGGQILPPIYKPLPVEEAARFRFTADSLRALSAETQARSQALQDGARTLRQNGTGVVERLREQARKLADEASLLSTQGEADARTAHALRAQAEEFARRAAQREERLVQLRTEILSLTAFPPPAAQPPMQPVAADSAPFPDSSAIAAVPAEAESAARIRELRGEIRADSLTALTFRAQAEELLAQARTREAAAADARKQAAEARSQEEQLRTYAAEIISGRTATEGTAARLEQQARELARVAELYESDARQRWTQAEEWRVQAGRNLFPVRSRVDAMRFYGEEGRSLLRNLVFSVSSGGGAGTIHSELISDYAGPVRIGSGLVLAESANKQAQTAADSAAVMEQARERFFAGGGNFVMYASLPLGFMRSDYHSLTLQTLGKVGLDVPGARRVADAGSVPANFDLGLETYATFNTFGSKIKAFALLRSAYAVGNQAFYDNLGHATRGGIPYAQLTFGTELASVAKVLLSGAYGGGDLSRDLSLTFQLAPNRN